MSYFPLIFYFVATYFAIGHVAFPLISDPKSLQTPKSFYDKNKSHASAAETCGSQRFVRTILSALQHHVSSPLPASIFALI